MTKCSVCGTDHFPDNKYYRYDRLLDNKRNTSRICMQCLSRIAMRALSWKDQCPDTKLSAFEFFSEIELRIEQVKIEAKIIKYLETKGSVIIFQHIESDMSVCIKLLETDLATIVGKRWSCLVKPINTTQKEIIFGLGLMYDGEPKLYSKQKFTFSKVPIPENQVSLEVMDIPVS